MQILEHEHGGAALGERLEEPAPGRRAPSAPALWLPSPVQPDEGAQLATSQRASLVLGDEPCDGVAQLPLGLLGCVGLEDARLRLDDLAERPEA